jgi:outer membrane protein insertion porin family/translocation and assembly module TamA
MRAVAWLLVLAAALASDARAVQLDALDTAREWTLLALRFEGNHALGSRTLRQAVVTKPRPWFTPWRAFPPFDPLALRDDLDRIERLYRSRGYYRARVFHDVEMPASGNAVTVVVYVEEGPPTTVASVDVAFEGEELPEAERRALLDGLPISRDHVFTEERYVQAASYLRAYYREHGFARVDVTRHARVDRDTDRAELSYRVVSGPTCVFGDVTVVGTKRTDQAIVFRELAFSPGMPFKQSRLERSRRDLVALSLFRSVRLDEDPGGGPRVDVQVRVAEMPQHEIRLGLGYDTEEQVRGLASWRDYDFMGGARQLGFTGRVSRIERAITADFLQPHFPGHDNRSRLIFTEARLEEDTYTVTRSRLSPRLEWQATEAITGFAFYRAEYDVLTSVNPEVPRKLPGVAPKNGILSGFGFGADWNTTDDLLDPTRGFVTGATVEPVGALLGGDFNFLRVVVEGRGYQRLVGRLLGAARFRLGSQEPFGGTPEIPLYERFYAGGINSIRGYGRRRVGRLVGNDPVGGRSLIETSLELRHPITDTIGGAVFLDAGQVGRHSLDFPVDDLRYGTGLGIRYKSPVGPLRLDLGFPFDPPHHDRHWQVYVSVGQTF